MKKILLSLAVIAAFAATCVLVVQNMDSIKKELSSIDYSLPFNTSDFLAQIIPSSKSVNGNSPTLVSFSETKEKKQPYFEEEKSPNIYTVWYGTNRKPVESKGTVNNYSEKRDDKLHYGSANIYIPESHKFGSIGSSLVVRMATFTDDRLKLESAAPLSKEDFNGRIRTIMQANEQGQRQILVYIHGYNTSFEEAAKRAAQIGFDLKVQGVTAFYSWPSISKVDDYTDDEATIETSEPYIIEFLQTLAKNTEAEKVHIIAHSMGNRGLLRSLQRIMSSAEQDKDIKFGQIFLAAPDVDTQLFKQLATVYPSLSERTTLYVSSADKIVRLSSWFHGAPRVGFAPPVTIVDGIDTVEVSNVDVTALGHGYYADASPLLYDMHLLLLNNEPPSKRIYLQEAATEEGKQYWKFSR